MFLFITQEEQVAFNLYMFNDPNGSDVKAVA